MNQATPCVYCGCTGYHMWAGSGNCPGAVPERERDAVATALLRDLKEQFQRAKEWNQLLEIQIKNLQSIVEDQKQLLARAAEMLETLGCKGPAVAELRKAAEIES